MILACHANQMLLICYSFWILEFLEGFCSVQYFQDFAILLSMCKPLLYFLYVSFVFICHMTKAPVQPVE